MMDSGNRVPENIVQILDQAGAYVGRYEAESFEQQTWCALAEGTITSPIEQALYIALLAVAKVNYIDEAEPIDTETFSPGIAVSPQRQIGKYRADFTVGYYPGGKGAYSEVVVECDGTAFHERTERERRLEKARDRYMQKQGLKVFRYTGREILEDPYKVAAEIIGHVTGDEGGVLTPEEYFS